MNNINLCAVDETGFCQRCGDYVRDPSYCLEFKEELAKYNEDGEWNYDSEDAADDIDISEYTE